MRTQALWGWLDDLAQHDMALAFAPRVRWAKLSKQERTAAAAAGGDECSWDYAAAGAGAGGGRDGDEGDQGDEKASSAAEPVSLLTRLLLTRVSLRLRNAEVNKKSPHSDQPSHTVVHTASPHCQLYDLWGFWYVVGEPVAAAAARGRVRAGRQHVLRLLAGGQPPPSPPPRPPACRRKQQSFRKSNRRPACDLHTAATFEYPPEH